MLFLQEIPAPGHVYKWNVEAEPGLRINFRNQKYASKQHREINISLMIENHLRRKNELCVILDTKVLYFSYPKYIMMNSINISIYYSTEKKTNMIYSNLK